MDLIIINGLIPISPSKYDVSFRNVNGAEEQLENGYTYIEQIRVQAPNISLAWVNIEEQDAISILNAVSPATFPCNYFFGSMKTDIFECKNPSLSLKLIDGDKRYYDLGLTLEG